MPRRVYTYPDGLGWNGMNLLASVGVVFIAASVIVFLGNVVTSLRSGVAAGANPWNAGTLEWAVSSPPPGYNFHYVPVVSGHEPLWIEGDERKVVTGLRANVREVLITHVVDARPDHRYRFSGPSIWPFLAAVATTGFFVGSIFTPWAIPIGAVPLFITLTGCGSGRKRMNQAPNRSRPRRRARHEAEPGPRRRRPADLRLWPIAASCGGEPSGSA
jgi:cytochrome c oxidase subunit 1